VNDAVSEVRRISVCRVCQSDSLEQVLSLGPLALTGVFVRPGQPDPPRVELSLGFCEKCALLQLLSSVDPSSLYAEYWYRSGTNETMRRHLAGIAEDVAGRVSLGANDICVDIGCNDGTLLQSYGLDNLVLIGVDPSDAILDIRNPRILAVNDYFSWESLKQHVGPGKVKALTSISMFYDLDDPHAFVRDVALALAPDGVWVTEMNYTGDLVENVGYDMISHEHVTYYTIRTFQELVARHGLHLNDVSFSPINGGSVRLFVSRSARISAAARDALETEDRKGLAKLQTYVELGARIERFKSRLTRYLQGLRGAGRCIAVYGASTRGNTLLQHCGLTREVLFAAADRNPGKWGLEMSGSRIPIMSEADVRTLHPSHLLALPYYFIGEFLARETSYMQRGGQIVVPLPALKAYRMENGTMVSEEIGDAGGAP